MSGRQARARRRHVRTMAQRAHSADERWFAQHPERRWMVRPALAGEFPAEVHHATHVLIVRDTGRRYHGKPVLILNPADYPSGRIPLEHQEMAHDVMGGPSRWLHEAHVATDWDAA